MGAADACARRLGLPILAHVETARLLEGKLTVTRLLADGDALDLGLSPDGAGSWCLQALHTPGHAPGHLSFYDPHYRLLFAGDMVSTLSSVAIVPPEGDLVVYLDSVRRLQALPARLLLPAHGAPTARPAFALEECLEHRRVRERQLLATLEKGPVSVPQLARDLYRGLPAGLAHLAEAQTLAGLLKLQREGRAATDGDVWRGAN
jgi:glyoxylase-like metal-dependent hydrolase (beta-lactamase superfamily II)